MTVIFSKKCELGLKAVLFLAKQENNLTFNATDISNSIDAPKEFVAKVLQELTTEGIIASKKGKNGGFYLNKSPKDIRLIDIVKAIDGLDVFNNCVLGFSGCGTNNHCPVHSKWGVIRNMAFDMLNNETLEELSKKV